MRKNLMGLTVFLLAAVLTVQPAYAARTRDQIAQERERTQQEQRDTQSRYEEAQGMLGDLEEEASALEEQIQELDAQLVEVIASVGLMEELIEDTQEQIREAQAEYDEAKAREDEQYAAMKKRIRYLYEKGDVSYVELFLKTGSWSDMLNRTEYVEKLSEYDANMLKKYILLKEEVAVKQAQLEDRESELEAQHHELEEEKAAMEEMMAEMQEISADYEVQIARVRQQAAAYKAQIKQQNAQLEKLQAEENEIIRQEEERRRAEEAARQAAQSGSGGSSAAQGSSGGLKTVPPPTGSSGADIARYACQFVGNPYVAGGTSLVNGADCSGFVMAVYQQYGYKLPRNSTAMRSAGREVSFDQAQAGDIVCYAGHVAIYLGDGRIVHASTERTGIKYGYVNYRPILTIRRIVG